MAGFDLFSTAEQNGVAVWPENEEAFSIFASLCTQWAHGMGGAVGLRYEALYPLLDRVAQDDAHWDELFTDVRVMEAAALQELHSQDGQD